MSRRDGSRLHTVLRLRELAETEARLELARALGRRRAAAQALSAAQQRLQLAFATLRAVLAHPVPAAQLRSAQDEVTWSEREQGLRVDELATTEQAASAAQQQLAAATAEADAVRRLLERQRLEALREAERREIGEVAEIVAVARAYATEEQA